jgi:hypothetical protein
MEFWIKERETAKNRITEIEKKIAFLHTSNTSNIARPERIAILRESLARAKLHSDFVERRIAAHQGDEEKRTARSELIDTLKTIHSPQKLPRPVRSPGTDRNTTS